MRAAFLTAALMHDWRHAPFSHLFEKHYNRKNRAEEFLLSLVDGPFKTDYAERKGLRKAPAEHEVFSAGVFLKHFKSHSKRSVREATRCSLHG